MQFKVKDFLNWFCNYPNPSTLKKNKVVYDLIKNELRVDNPTIFKICKERIVRATRKIKIEIDEKIKQKQKEIKELKSQLDIDGKEEKNKITQSKNKSI